MRRAVDMKWGDSSKQSLRQVSEGKDNFGPCRVVFKTGQIGVLYISKPDKVYLGKLVNRMMGLAF